MKLLEQTLTQLIIISLAGAPAAAASEYVRHQAHAHGIAELTIALEGNRLEMIFTSPAMSLVGFEHKTSNPQHIAAVAKAAMALGDAEALFTLKGTNCAADDAQVDMSAVTASIEPETQKTPDAHDHHGTDDEEGSHADISAHYSYTCADIADLQSLRLGPGKLPFSLEEVNVMWVSEQGQGATVLTPENQLIEFN